MAIRTENLSSSAILSATYDDETQQLEVTFTSGGSYTLRRPVPPEVFNDFITSGSPGGFWHSVLKGQYT